MERDRGNFKPVNSDHDEGQTPILYSFIHAFKAHFKNDKSTSEVDFIVEEEEKIIPIEVKSGENLKARSFRLFCEKYKPSKAIRTSLSDYKEESWMANVPLYAIQ